MFLDLCELDTESADFSAKLGSFIVNIIVVDVLFFNGEILFGQLFCSAESCFEILYRVFKICLYSFGMTKQFMS